MEKLKIILILLIIILTITSLTTAIIILNNKSKLSIETSYYNGLPIQNVCAEYTYDMRTAEKSVGATDYTFIAKINGIIRTEYRNPIEVEINAEGTKTKTVSDPYTIYSVTVIENIKGNLITTRDIEVEQMGGIAEDGKSYVLLEGTELLKVGEYYILLAFVPFEKGALQINNPATIVSLGNIRENDTIKAIGSILTAGNTSTIKSISDNVLKNDKVDGKIINEVSKYANAYLVQVVPDGISTESQKIIFNKSIYDISYSQ